MMTHVNFIKQKAKLSLNLQQQIQVYMITVMHIYLLTLFRMGLFGAPHWCRGRKVPLPKTCHTYPTMMKLGRVVPYLKRIQKTINYVRHILSFADISIFSSEIGSVWYIKKYRYRLHFNK